MGYRTGPNTMEYRNQFFRSSSPYIRDHNYCSVNSFSFSIFLSLFTFGYLQPEEAKTILTLILQEDN